MNLRLKLSTYLSDNFKIDKKKLAQMDQMFGVKGQKQITFFSFPRKEASRAELEKDFHSLLGGNENRVICF